MTSEGRSASGFIPAEAIPGCDWCGECAWCQQVGRTERQLPRTCPFCHAGIDQPCWDEDNVFGKRVRTEPHRERQFGLTAEDIRRGMHPHSCRCDDCQHDAVTEHASQQW